MHHWITIRKNAEGYFATFHGPHAREIRELFGTTTLPLPFTAAAKSTRVMQDAQSRYPESTVSYSMEPAPPHHCS